MRVNFRNVPRANMSPAKQVALCGGDIPPFLQREKPVKGFIPHVHVSRWVGGSAATPRYRELYPLTDADLFTIDLLSRAEDIRREVKKQERAASRPKKMSTHRREHRSELVDMKTIAVDLNMIPRQCRAALRAAKVEKPSYGWAFKAEDVAKIKAIILKQDADSVNKKAKRINTQEKSNGKVKEVHAEDRRARDNRQHSSGRAGKPSRGMSGGRGQRPGRATGKSADTNARRNRKHVGKHREA